jgi:hypothetical protein
VDPGTLSIDGRPEYGGWRPGRAEEEVMRLFYLPWTDLTPEERAIALREARRHGALGARADRERCQRDRGNPVPIARPALYVLYLLQLAPEPWNRQWHRLTDNELCDDLRVCYYGEGWEQERRALAGEPPLPQEMQELVRYVTKAREAWVASCQERIAAVGRTAGLSPWHPDRLAAARGLMRLDRTEDEYWLSVMLTRVAEWECLGRLREASQGRSRSGVPRPA